MSLGRYMHQMNFSQHIVYESHCLVVFSMATVLGYIAAILPRLLFTAHGIVALWLLVKFSPSQTIFWAFCGGLGCLFVESIYTIAVRKGVEYKYFWPSCFFYLCTLLPITWSAEWTLLEGRLNNVTDDKRMFVAGFFVGQEELKKFCKIGLMLIIILGRWMLPRGAITRDQLSMLLLGYVAIAADILELFEAFEDEQVARNKEITLATLVVFSWSLFQFTLITASMGRKNEDQEEEKDGENLGQTGNVSRVEAGLTRKYLQKAIAAKKREKHRQQMYNLTDEDAEMRKLEIQGDRYGIIAAMFMQDGPFLILRLYLVIKYDFFMDAKFLFYIGKNIISLLLMTYRLYVIYFHAKEEEFKLPEKPSLRSLSFVMIGVRRFKSRKSKSRKQSRPGIQISK